MDGDESVSKSEKILQDDGRDLSLWRFGLFVCCRLRVDAEVDGCKDAPEVIS